MSKKLNVGIAGFGVVGQRRMHFINKHSSMDVVAACDISFTDLNTAIESQKHSIKIFSHYSELLKEDLDVLFVCLPNYIAPEVTMAALDRGLHVFCEKPPGRNLQDIADVRAVEKKQSQLKLMYGFNHRYHDSVIAAKQMIDSNELGRIINLRGVYGKSKIISYDSSWRSQRELSGGGILIDQGIHMADLIRFFAGEFTQFKSFVDNSFWNYDIEDNAYALMKSDSGIVAILHSTATQWRHRFSLEISLEKGAISLSGFLSGSKSYGAETITIAYPDETNAGNPREVTTKYNTDNSWWSEICYFCDSILNDTTVEQGSSWDAYQTMKMVYKIYCADPVWREKYGLSDQADEEV